jgi:hypothetical protein
MTAPIRNDQNHNPAWRKTVQPYGTAYMTSTPAMDDDIVGSLALARAEMADGETLIWADMSSTSSARRRVLPLSLLGWLLLLLALIWMAKAASASFSLLILGLPFLLSALALALLPWWWPRITRHTVYAMSERRLLMIQTWPRRRVTSYGPDDIDVVERRDYKDGTGDIVFRREEHRRQRHRHDPQGKRRVSDRPIGFFGVPDARRVEMAIWALKERRTVPPFFKTPPKGE